MGVLSAQLFLGDRALNNCLNSDPHHVTPGAVGDHVSKIQDALFLLMNDGVIDHTEIKEKRYGTTTANAVLAYKRKFDIVNRSYQQTADNIVGKMTIARLDQDMRIKEADFPRMIESARVGAFLRCQTAHQRMVGFGPPAPSPKRIDPNDIFKQRALDAARNMFDRADLELEDMDADAPIPITVGKMKNSLASSSLPTVTVSSSDPRRPRDRRSRSCLTPSTPPCPGRSDRSRPDGRTSPVGSPRAGPSMADRPSTSPAGRDPRGQRSAAGPAARCPVGAAPSTSGRSHHRKPRLRSSRRCRYRAARRAARDRRPRGSARRWSRPAAGAGRTPS